MFDSSRRLQHTAVERHIAGSNHSEHGLSEASMPGIVGLITKMLPERAERELQRMVEAIRHEPFYEVGTWSDKALGVYVGWAAIEGSFSGGMPLHNETGDATLIFSGEEYPDPEAIRGLKRRGHSVARPGPSYLIHLYEDDRSFPAKLNGMFHGLLADRARGAALLFNDRYGMHRIYYHESKEAFYFAAEAKAIVRVRPEVRGTDPQALGEFIACGCVLENRTLFDGMRVLPAASAWVFRNGSIELRKAYFQPKEWEQQSRLGPEAFYGELRNSFARNLPRYFNGSRPVGMSLTGGLDTRMIMAWQKADPGSLPCYTFGGPFRDSRDVVVAREVARACGQRHEVIPVGTEFLSRFPHYAERAVCLSDGCVTVDRAADLYVNERARQIAPVRVTGNYGSEVLRWAPAFKPARGFHGVFSQECCRHIDAAGSTYASLVKGHPVSFAAFRQAPWHHHGLLSLEQTQLSVRTPYLDNDFVAAAFRAPAPAFSRRDTANIDHCLRLVADGDATLSEILTDRGLGPPAGVNATVARHVHEFTFRAEYAYDYGMPQWAARVDHLFAPLHLERLFLGRHKFAHFRFWYRDALSEYVRQMLLDPRTLARPYLRPAGVESIVRGHLKGNRNFTVEINKVLTLELFHRLFVDPN